MKYTKDQIKFVDLTDAKTFNEWQRLGYCVVCGEKAAGFKNGKAVFLINQVEKVHKYYEVYDYNDDCEDDSYFSAFEYIVMHDYYAST